MLKKDTLIDPLYSEKLSYADRYLKSHNIENKQLLLFDIETTGLSHRYSHLYMIGAVFSENNHQILRQWLVQKPADEKKVLEEFAALLNDTSLPVCYNGITFDIPYLRDRYAYWDIKCPFPDRQSAEQTLDLYQYARLMGKYYTLKSMKQKDIESLLSVSRKDLMSGGELIPIYENYVRTLDPEAEQLLFLHNHDDLLGMIALLPILNYKRLTENDFYHTLSAKFNEKQELLTITFRIADQLPKSLSIEFESAHLAVYENCGSLTIEGKWQTRKMFFKNYKDYFYLPIEDTAIHKSVGRFVDPSCRQKAKAATCYQKKEAVFFYQPAPVITPCFLPEYGSKNYAFLFDDQISEVQWIQLIIKMWREVAEKGTVK